MWAEQIILAVIGLSSGAVWTVAAAAVRTARGDVCWLLVDGVGGDLKCISDFCETVENCALYFRIYTQHGARKRSGSSAVFL